MKRFHCRCGQTIYFESYRCVACGAALGFDGASLRMLALGAEGERLAVANERGFRYCANGIEHGVCNWLVPDHDERVLCFACRFNRTIPDLGEPPNFTRWSKFESSKRRLLFTLLSLRLPITSGHDDPRNGLLIDLVEDSRSDPERFPETFVHTGYLGGVVTINALEADDAVREAMRVRMGESYRTMLGHLRHESGHYFWSLFDAGADDIADFRRLFGDPQLDYADALEAYYADGPAPDWPDRHISAYASSHPIEDWAESWGHYLHIHDVLETAVAHGVAPAGTADAGIRESIAAWRSLSVTLNELNRSLGIGDAYPFVVSAVVEDKLVFVDSVIRRLQASRSGRRFGPAGARP